MKYRKKPVTVEVRQFTGDNHAAIEAFVGRALAREAGNGLIIPTLEGQHVASPGDFIIRGVHGEFYPCKPDVFAETYEPAS